MYDVSAQGIDEPMINGHYYYYHYYLQLHQSAGRPIESQTATSIFHVVPDDGKADVDILTVKLHPQNRHKGLDHLIRPNPPWHQHHILPVYPK